MVGPMLHQILNDNRHCGSVLGLLSHISMGKLNMKICSQNKLYIKG